MEVSEHCFSPPSPHKEGFVWIHLGQEESHGPTYAEVAVDDVCSHELNIWALLYDNRTDGGGVIGAANLFPCLVVLDTCNGGVAGGSLESAKALVGQGESLQAQLCTRAP